MPPADMTSESKLIEEEKERLREVAQRAGDKVNLLSFQETTISQWISSRSCQKLRLRVFHQLSKS